MKKGLKLLDKLDLFIVTLMVILMFFDIILQVASRLLPGNAISWTIELGEIMMGIMVWIGISAVVRHNSHMKFDLLLNALPKKVKLAVNTLNSALFVVYLLLLAWFTTGAMGQYLRLKDTTVLLGINNFWVRLPILVGCIATILSIPVKMHRDYTSKEETEAENCCDDVSKGGV